MKFAISNRTVTIKQPLMFTYAPDRQSISVKHPIIPMRFIPHDGKAKQ